MSNFNTLEQPSAFMPYAPERELTVGPSSYGLTKKESRFLGGIVIDMSQADDHHIELHGIHDAVELAKLDGSQKLTNAIHMIGQHMTDKVDVEIAKIQKLRRN